MRKNVYTIVKKEFRRFFGDWRMIISAILLPAVLTYAMFALIGGNVVSQEDFTPICLVENLPESFESVFESIGCDLRSVEDTEEAKTAITDQDAELLVIFPVDFDEIYGTVTAGNSVPNIEVYYNSTSEDSYNIYDAFCSAANTYESAIANTLDINRDVPMADLASSENFASIFLASMLPMMLISALFTGCLSFSTESIAGEKERGTIATMLVTPVSRSSIAIGKVISLSVFALMAGLAEFISCMVSIPKMTGSLVSMNVYSIREYGSLLAIIITTVLLVVSMLSIVSTYAKSVKQASAIGSAFLILAMLASFLPSLPVDFSGLSWKFIPVFNSILCLKDIFSFTYTMSEIAITCASNLVYMLGLVFVLSRMFNSEKIMFSK